MKRLVIIPLMIMATTLHAQIQLGLKAGVNISNFTGGDFNEIENKALVGFHAGGLARIVFNKLALQPEVVFSSQGAKLENAGSESNYKISYINIPVLIQYETKGGFYLEAGPQFGFKLSEDIPDETIEDFAKSTDLSIAMGLGYHSKMGLGIGGRYNVGVSKVGDFDSGDIDPDFKQGVIQISLFYTFFNKK
ncbi:PorT family protein [Chitinophagaceae bacterium LB-8]|uniref:PorT family protein n=1 Tax=Paraflavisolibacter caeni TaxID=2982496 RepID=A0A9X3B6Y1_9BACT|nr:porin family protein [Paraflavisolibacter caeni]MCU7548630.1 PorT family protein [Paraflavisolibacter caeni]